LQMRYCLTMLSSLPIEERCVRFAVRRSLSWGKRCRTAYEPVRQDSDVRQVTFMMFLALFDSCEQVRAELSAGVRHKDQCALGLRLMRSQC
jgi:hypothetical protein